MRKFNYKNIGEHLLTSDIVMLMARIHEYKGENKVLSAEKSDILMQLVEIAKIQSTGASNRIEGIYTSDGRLKKIVKEKTMPRNRDEQEIAGYRDVLTTIHENFNYIPVKPTIILQFHRDLYKYSGMGLGGKYKLADNVITEEINGEKMIRFQPMPAWAAPEAIEQICVAFEKAVMADEMDPLLIIPVFILDFLCIHPFEDGNGRMSRLLTLLLLYRADYNVGKYISLEKRIEDTKETYYRVLQESSNHWHEGDNDYKPFVKYTLELIASAYRELSERTQLLEKGASKGDRVREIIRNKAGKITKREILEQCPDISEITVQRALSELQKSGDILKIGGGRYTAYIWNREKE